jgi:hypothetical protein
MFPTEVEADFAHWYPTEDLGAWHRGDVDSRGRLVLSSRRLCVLLGGLDPYSNYKTSQRGGYLPERDLVVYETYNEIARLRASYYAIKGGEEARYEPHQFIDPIRRFEMAIAEEERDEETHDASEQLYGDMGL